MTEVRGVWDFTGLPENLDIIIKVNPVFCAYTFPSELRSKQAWEAGNRVGQHVSIWRMTDSNKNLWRVLCMGEQSHRVQRVEAALVENGGTPWEPQVDLVRSLALRRYKLALDEAKEAVRTGRAPTDLKTENRWGDKPMKLNEKGEMSPYKGDDAA